MNTPNALAPHSGGSLLPYILVGFGDDTWGIMDGRTSHYAMFADMLRLWRSPQEAEDWVDGASEETAGEGYPLFAPLLLDGKPRERSII